MQVYNQNLVIDHLNQYLKFKARPMHLNHGYCHGLTLLWLYKMSNDQEDWFYDMVKKIVGCHTKTQYQQIEQDIEKFLSFIEWLQNSSDYAIGFNQLDIDKLLELPRELSLSFLFNPHQLNTVIKKIMTSNKMICVSGPNHTIGVFKREQKFYLYDPNYHQGEAKIFDDIDQLKLEILNCLFFKLDLKGLPYPILFNVTSNQSKLDENPEQKNELYFELLRTQRNLNVSGTNGFTHLYAACENNNIDQVEILLRDGANPNLGITDGTTPLQMAALKGYRHIVKVLLDNGAAIDQQNKHHHTALFYAIDGGHAEVVELLLRAGADLYHTVKRETYLAMALQFHRWDCVIALLKHDYKANRYERGLLHSYAQQLKHEASKQWQTLSNEEKYRLLRYIQKEKGFSFFQKRRNEVLCKDQPVVFCRNKSL